MALKNIFHKLIIFICILLTANICAKAVPIVEVIVYGLISRAQGSIGGQVNVIISMVCLMFMPIAFLYFFKIKPINVLALFVLFIPILARFRKVIGIYGYTAWTGAPALISAIELLIPVLLIYLLVSYPIPLNKRGWDTPSAKAYLVMTLSGIFTQLFFFSAIPALRIGYMLVGVQFLWFLLVVAYIKKTEDVYRVVWGIVGATMISVILTFFTSGDNASGVFNSGSYRRLSSLHMGSANEYGVLMTSTICLLPMLLLRYKKRVIQLIILLLPFIMLKTLIATGTRGAYLSSLPILYYLYYFRTKRQLLMMICLAVICAAFLFHDQVLFYLASRKEHTFGGGRLENIIAILNALWKWPYFFIGYGKGTISNWAIPGVLFGHDAHQGFLQIWINTGFVGFVAFIYFIFKSITTGWRAVKNTIGFEEKLVPLGLVLCIFSWLILFCTTKGKFTGGLVSLYLVLTTEIALLVAISQKNLLNSPTNSVTQGTT